MRTFLLNKLFKDPRISRFIRIYPDGRIKYSQRLTVKARCQMDLHNFPLDKQICPLSIGSFGHTTDDIIYREE